MSSPQNERDKTIIRLTEDVRRLTNTTVVLLVVSVFLGITHITGLPDLETIFPKTDHFISTTSLSPEELENRKILLEEFRTLWQPPAFSDLSNSDHDNMVKYGRKLIENTAFYLGPNGIVDQISNGMNCQNCHLQAGTKPFGNNYGAVASTYPKYRSRSGEVEDIYKRVNDCFERSLNGRALANDSREMQAIAAYITFLGRDVAKGEKPKGSGIAELSYLDRPADPVKGGAIYDLKCKYCHQSNGEGVTNGEERGYQYPPLWGDHSYNSGAGLYRNSRFAGYVKYNMPLGATYLNPMLTDEEAWDLAAYVNSQPRPSKDISKDWPKMEEKPVDHPFGPYADSFTEEQHKYGPFAPIAEAKKAAIK